MGFFKGIYQGFFGVFQGCGCIIGASIGFLVLLLLLALLAGGCASAPVPVPHEVEVWLIDDSNSALLPKPDTAYFRAYLERRLTAADGRLRLSFAVLDIGLEHDTATAIRLEQKPWPLVDGSETPTHRKKQQADRARRIAQNAQALDVFRNQVQNRFLYLNGKGAPATALNETLHRATLLLNEPRYRRATSKRLVLISDCIPDPDGDNRPDSLRHSLDRLPDLQLALVGCTQPEAFNGLTIQQYESIAGLLPELR